MFTARRRPFMLVAPALALAVAAGVACADTFVLTPSDDVNATINGAQQGDTVILGPGPNGETLYDFQNIVIHNRPITIVADNSQGQIRIRARNGTAFDIRDTPVGSGGERLTLRGLEIVGDQGINQGYTGGPNGGCMWINNTDILIESCAFIGNDVGTYAGGGIFMNLAVDADIVASTFSTLEAREGGAIFIGIDNEARLDECLFFDNLASVGANIGSGGAIYVYPEGRLHAEDTTFRANRASDGGGAIRYFSNDPDAPPLTIDRCFFEANNGVGFGGAISGTGTWHISDTLFGANNSFGWGGALSRESGGFDLRTSGCSFVGNIAGAFGGAIGSGSTNAIISANNTYIDNTAADGQAQVCGGGAAFATFTNDILRDATDTTYRGPILTASAGSLEVTYCAIQASQAATYPSPTNLTDSLFFVTRPTPGPNNWFPDYQDNNYGDLRLVSFSPGIDAGNISAWDLARFGTLDPNGAPRFINLIAAPDTGLAFGHEYIDIGAFETQGDGPQTGCNFADVAEPYGVLNTLDVLAFLNEWAGGCD